MKLKIYDKLFKKIFQEIDEGNIKFESESGGYGEGDLIVLRIRYVTSKKRVVVVTLRFNSETAHFKSMGVWIDGQPSRYPCEELRDKTTNFDYKRRKLEKIVKEYKETRNTKYTGHWRAGHIKKAIN